MEFGKINFLEGINFNLPPISPFTFKVLKKYTKANKFNVFVGAPQWGKNELKGFYPKGTKDELSYYATQFNSIEFNATFFKTPTKQQVQIWKNKTPSNFKFFPKIPKSISHYSKLINTDFKVLEFIDAMANFEDKLGCIFLQLNDNFHASQLENLSLFLQKFPKGFPLAVEVRSQTWFENEKTKLEYLKILEYNNVANIIVDTPGRRDLLHMSLTNHTLFVRFVATNTNLDNERLLQWAHKIKELYLSGLQNVYFFVHQEVQATTPFLATYFINQLNSMLTLQLSTPNKNLTLF